MAGPEGGGWTFTAAAGTQKYCVRPVITHPLFGPPSEKSDWDGRVATSSVWRTAWVDATLKHLRESKT